MATETDATVRVEGSSRTVLPAIAALAFGGREAIRFMKREETSAKDAAAATDISPVALKVAPHRGAHDLRDAQPSGR